MMERTGHHSLEGVRSYKRTSDTQREALSNILNYPKQPRVHTVASVSQLPPSNSAAPTYISTTASQKNEVLRGLNFPSETFNGCTVNFLLEPRALFQDLTVQHSFWLTPLMLCICLVMVSTTTEFDCTPVMSNSVLVKIGPRTIFVLSNLIPRIGLGLGLRG